MASVESQKIAVKEAMERSNQQRAAVQEAKTGIKSSEMRANQQQALLRGQTSQRSKATQYSPLSGVASGLTPGRLFGVSQRPGLAEAVWEAEDKGFQANTKRTKDGFYVYETEGWSS